MTGIHPASRNMRALVDVGAERLELVGAARIASSLGIWQ
jgi:hypothetical protein